VKPENIFVGTMSAVILFVVGGAAYKQFSPPTPLIKAEPVTDRDRELVKCRARGGEPVRGVGMDVVCVKALGK
jgi:hypothetical protein